ncbi:MAG TPA: type II 3-dehydroquinate dehydratase [Bacteroidia bacterium]|nr:type II 3-dehydroquinate dehydratase [Bacteroidia bacterium]HNS11857.1 type II 3-dehydroquinate dehydratase [Bacteroidia bacterium]
MKLLILNGPNLNLLGQREPSIYGEGSFDTYLESLRKRFSGVEIDYFQSNVEGEIINRLHSAMKNHEGIILNAGGYTHTSVSISDAIAAINVPVIEVHISNIHAREEYRHNSLLAKNCAGVITGFGLHSYALAIEAFLFNGKK